MQTFMPYDTYMQSARCLDRQRLGKQRLEANDILGILTEFAITTHSDKQQAYLLRRYPNHPAIEMWRTHERQLAIYGWTPHWLGDPLFHISHRSNLLRKMPEHYKQFGWDIPDTFEYVWPSPSPATGLAS